MFVAVIVVCSTLEVTSCETRWNKQGTFATEADCNADTLGASQYFMQEGNYVADRDCIEIIQEGTDA